MKLPLKEAEAGCWPPPKKLLAACPGWAAGWLPKLGTVSVLGKPCMPPPKLLLLPPGAVNPPLLAPKKAGDVPKPPPAGPLKALAAACCACCGCWFPNAPGTMGLPKPATNSPPPMGLVPNCAFVL